MRRAVRLALPFLALWAPARASGSPCTSATTNSLVVPLAGIADGFDEAELQFCAGAGCAPHAAISTLGAKAAELTIADLWENTTYTLFHRGRNNLTWSPLKPAGACRTAALLPGQPGRMRVPVAPAVTAVTLEWSAASADAVDGFIVEVVDEGTGESLEFRASPGARFLRAEGLRPGEQHAARVRSARPDAPWSDPLRFSTASPSTARVSVIRIAELCGDSCEGPDYLTNKNGADPAADVAFIMAAIVGTRSRFGVRFATAVVARYCAERRADVPLNAYMSCDAMANKPGEDHRAYTCHCTNSIDAAIARRSVPGCERQALGLHPGICKCPPEEQDRGQEVVGEMPVYLPFARLENGTFTSPPANVSYRCGAFLSFPRAGECAPGQAPRPGPGGAEPTCGWRLEPRVDYVRGQELLDLGWRVRAPLPGDHLTPVNVEDLAHNRAVLHRALDDHRPGTARGC